MSIGRAISVFVTWYGMAILGYLALNGIASRFLGQAEFGYFVGAVTLTATLGQLGLIGVHRSGLREASRLGHDDLDQLGELRRGVRATLLLSLPAVSVASGAAIWLLQPGRPPMNRFMLAAGMALLVYLSGQQKVWSNYLRGFGHVRFASMLEGRSGGALVAFFQAALLLLVWLVFPSWGLAGALLAVALGYLVPDVLAWRWVSRSWGHTPANARLWRDLKQVARRDWRFASVQVALMVNASVEIWIAGVVLTGADTSAFGAAQRLSMLIVLPMTAIQIVLSPVIARMVVQPDRHPLQEILRTGATAATAATVVLWLPIVIAPNAVMRVVFGRGFEDTPVLPVILLCSALVVNAAMGLAGLTLSMAHREGIVASTQWMTFVGRVVVGTVAASLYGLTGLAISSFAFSSVFYVWIWVRVRRELGVNTATTLHPDIRLVRESAN